MEKLLKLSENLSGENGTEATKASWLSHRFNKDYSLIVVYLRQLVKAAKFLPEGYFYVGGLSGQTSIFKRQQRPNLCYNCQELANHRAFRCQKPQIYANLYIPRGTA